MSAGSADNFLRVQKALKNAGVAWPTIFIDLPALDRNLAKLKTVVARRSARLVGKSLPCPKLLDRARNTLGTNRFMTFNLPMLLEVARQFPEASQMLGKPLPVEAAVRFLDNQGSAANVIWLIDTLDRLQEYQTLAAARNITLDIALEIDIGLHRGGFRPDADMTAALGILKESKALKLAGLMGYEAHLAALPTLFGWREQERRKSLYALEKARGLVETILGAEIAERLIINSAGSKTLGLHDRTSVATELSAGSILVKPTDFDHPLTAEFEPAFYIATQVLKGPAVTQIPGMERLSKLRNLLSPSASRSIFIHGGHWMAEPVYPQGLRYHGLIGRSSNQEILTCRPNTAIKPGDFVFFRPHQSEAVFLQFGDIAVFDGKTISDQWPVFPASA